MVQMLSLEMPGGFGNGTMMYNMPHTGINTEGGTLGSPPLRSAPPTSNFQVPLNPVITPPFCH